MSDVYDQHQAAFRHVAAYIVLDRTGDRVATVAFKYAASGLRTTCYMHWLSVPMVRDSAVGGGYDLDTIAAYSAARKVDLPSNHPFKTAIKLTGQRWDLGLQEAGFIVLQAV